MKIRDEMMIGDLIDKNLAKKIKKLSDIDIKAKKERELEETLEGIKSNWDKEKKIIFTFNEISNSEELFDEIDDSLAKVSDVQCSK